MVPLLLLATAARAEMELAAGPNLQIARGSQPDATLGTGFLVRGLESLGTSHAMGFAIEGLWLVPTAMPEAPIVSQQDLLFINRLRPPVGLTETLAIDLGAGLTRYSGARDTYHFTFQIGASICGRLGRRWSFEFGARFALTPNLFYRDATGMFVVPAGFVTRFGGLISARL